jgi:hypothetical protein
MGFGEVVRRAGCAAGRSGAATVTGPASALSTLSPASLAAEALRGTAAGGDAAAMDTRCADGKRRCAADSGLRTACGDTGLTYNSTTLRSDIGGDCAV